MAGLLGLVFILAFSPPLFCLRGPASLQWGDAELYVCSWPPYLLRNALPVVYVYAQSAVIHGQMQLCCAAVSVERERQATASAHTASMQCTYMYLYIHTYIL